MSGRTSLEDKLGVERFKQLMKSMPREEVQALICDHEVTREKKMKCQACKRAIYRAMERVKQRDRKEKTFAPIEEFAAIPEIQNFIEYQKAKKVQHTELLSKLSRMWQWIRESGNSELIETQRPAMWTIKHVQYLLIKIDETKTARYQWVQALRRLFESMKRLDMTKEPLLRARRKDMRSPDTNGARPQDRFTPEELGQILALPELTAHEKLVVKVHVTLKCREGNEGAGSLLGLKWSDIDWNDGYYGFPMVTAKVYEPKTAGGTYWNHCPIDLWFNNLSQELRQEYEARKSGMTDQALIDSETIAHMDYEGLMKLWHKISAAIGKKLEPHDCRRSPSGWLRDLGMPELAIGQYNPTTGQAVGYCGVGWENSEIYFQRYGKMNPLAIYDKTKRLDCPLFDGLIKKILDARRGD